MHFPQGLEGLPLYVAALARAAGAVVVTAMIGVALVFTALWLLLLVQGMKVDRIVSEREQSDAGEPAPDAA